MVCEILWCMQLKKSHNPEQQRNELLLVLDQEQGMLGMLRGFFFLPACSGPPVGKGAGGGVRLTHSNLTVVTSAGRRLTLSTEKTSTLSWVQLHFFFTAPRTLTAVIPLWEVTAGENPAHLCAQDEKLKMQDSLCRTFNVYFLFTSTNDGLLTLLILYGTTNESLEIMWPTLIKMAGRRPAGVGKCFAVACSRTVTGVVFSLEHYFALIRLEFHFCISHPYRKNKQTTVCHLLTLTVIAIK